MKAVDFVMIIFFLQVHFLMWWWKEWLWRWRRSRPWMSNTKKYYSQPQPWSSSRESKQQPLWCKTWFHNILKEQSHKNAGKCLQFPRKPLLGLQQKEMHSKGSHLRLIFSVFGQWQEKTEKGKNKIQQITNNLKQCSWLNTENINILRRDWKVRWESSGCKERRKKEKHFQVSPDPRGRGNLLYVPIVRH